jgi:hypothetical protein
MISSSSASAIRIVLVFGAGLGACLLELSMVPTTVSKDMDMIPFSRLTCEVSAMLEPLCGPNELWLDSALLPPDAPYLHVDEPVPS